MWQKKFNLNLSESNLKFIRLKLTTLLKDTTYPRLTLLGQIVGSFLLGIEAVLRHQPKCLVDTLGNAFIYPPFGILGTRIIAYTHYPFISEDMIAKVESGRADFNNSTQVSGSYALTKAKVTYYRLLLRIYQYCGRFIHTAMANSSWTHAHLERLWGKTNLRRVYPPCDVTPFVPIAGAERSKDIVSLAQFRPEKNHALQLEAFAVLLRRCPDTQSRLILIGGCRDSHDWERVASLKTLSASLGIASKVTFMVDAKFSEITATMQSSLIGLHTMVDEHFGISIVECMAAGLVTVANRSGGPLADLIDDGLTGFLARTADEYADCFEAILRMNQSSLERIRVKALSKATKAFSLQVFGDSLAQIVQSAS